MADPAVILVDPRTFDWSTKLSLSRDEIGRSERFLSALDRLTYIATHEALRRALGRLIGVAPASLVFAEDGEGRPVLASRPSVNFSVSHARGLGAIAISSEARVGIDVDLAERGLAWCVEEASWKADIVDPAGRWRPLALPAGFTGAVAMPRG